MVSPPPARRLFLQADICNKQRALDGMLTQARMMEFALARDRLVLSVIEKNKVPSAEQPRMTTTQGGRESGNGSGRSEEGHLASSGEKRAREYTSYDDTVQWLCEQHVQRASKQRRVEVGSSDGWHE